MNPEDMIKRLQGVINRLGQSNAQLTVQAAEYETVLAEKIAEIKALTERLDSIEPKAA
jgi:hypothetical protein